MISGDLERQFSAVNHFYLFLGLDQPHVKVDDVCISARKGLVIVRSSKGDTCREIPLDADVREDLKIWLKERTT